MKDSTLRSQLYASLILDPKAFEAAKRTEEAWEEMRRCQSRGDGIGYAIALKEFQEGGK